jgi:N-acetylglucosamine-6-sulfatase
MGSSARRWTLGLPHARFALAMLAALVAVPVLAVVPSAPSSSAAGEKPTVVLIVTDDQRYDTLAQMPATRDLLARRGVTFSNAMVPTSLCCPARASLLTGRFAHETRVWSNLSSVSGGWPAMHNNGNEARTLAVYLKAQGYRTALVGKYLNLYGSAAPLGYVPPGWDVFDAFMVGGPVYYNYRLSDLSWHDASPED